jgi:hypothetical protein
MVFDSPGADEQSLANFQIGYRHITIEIAVEPAQHARSPRRAHPVTLTVVGRAGALMGFNRCSVVALDVQCSGETLQQVATLAHRQRRFERGLRGLAIAASKRGDTLVNQRLDSGVHAHMIARGSQAPGYRRRWPLGPAESPPTDLRLCERANGTISRRVAPVPRATRPV